MKIAKKFSSTITKLGLALFFAGLLTACPQEAKKTSVPVAAEKAIDAPADEIIAAKPTPAAAADNSDPKKSTPGLVDYSCKTSSDCKIKDVGSCCGYRPACVNKNSPTYAAEVKAQCGKEGMAGICGFPSIGSCTCTNNKCEGVSGSAGEAVAQ